MVKGLGIALFASITHYIHFPRIAPRQGFLLSRVQNPSSFPCAATRAWVCVMHRAERHPTPSPCLMIDLSFHSAQIPDLFREGTTLASSALLSSFTRNAQPQIEKKKLK
jgi:hypothetical protein